MLPDLFLLQYMVLAMEYNAENRKNQKRHFINFNYETAKATKTF